MASEILKKKKKFEESDDPAIKSMDMFKDRNPADRELIKELVIEMKAKNATLQTQTDPSTGLPIKNKYVIRGFKLVLVDENNKAVSL